MFAKLPAQVFTVSRTDLPFRTTSSYETVAYMNRLLLALSLVVCCLTQSVVSQQRPTVTLRGRVVDARTGEPIAKVKTIANAAEQSTTTDDNGEFTFQNIPVGQVDLYITTVNYGLVKKTITLEAGQNEVFLIALNEDAAALTEHVTITPDPYETSETNSASEKTLNKRELQALSSVLLGDPVRAAQALPGATSNDDFRSEFAIRGAGFDRIGLYLDDVLTDSFVHTVQGGFPDTGADNRGSYLFAARKSYVGYLVRRINDTNQFTNNPPVLGFADVQAKALYDLLKRNQVGVSVIYGAFNYDRNRDRNLLGVNNVFRGDSRNLLLNGYWSFTKDPRLLWQTRVFGLRTTFKNINGAETTLDDGKRTQFGVRSDVNFQPSGSHRIEAGIYIRSLRVDTFSRRFDFFARKLDVNGFNRRGAEQAYYAQETWSNERTGLSLTGGVRLEHSGTTGETLLSPRTSFSWAISDKWRIRAAAGRYYQFPDFEQMFGRLGNPGLRAERSTHYNASIERLFGDRIRLLAEVYDRKDASLFFSLFEPRLVGNSVTFAEFPFRNALRGKARGVELNLQRRSANKLAGWISYAYSRTQLTDAQTGLSFVSDTDQRHTVNVYGSYRFTDTWNLSGAWRYGSGQPVPGFFRQVGSGFFLSSKRNLARLPDYSRADLRLSKAFLFRKWKLTVTGEVINALNRNNVRYAGFDGFGFDGRVFGQLDRVLPILPSVGVVIEF
ncbi:MAG: TonB-dependent receptor [Acidobacteria bacterium]|nr:TonB-dependent receptor [Acidobacteriota bacterium]